MPSSLNPNVRPFPAYIPAPIAPSKSNLLRPSTSPSNSSSWSSRSKDLTLTSRSPTSQNTPFPTYQAIDSQETRVGDSDEGEVYPIKQFGHGWSSTPTHTAPAPAPALTPVVKLTASMSELLANHTPTPIRTRSPSMPILPSSNTNIFASDSDPIVSHPTRDRYKHLQVPDRVSRYDSVNGHSYINHDIGGGRGLGHSPSVPNLTGNGQAQAQGYRRSSLVNSWRDGIPEETEVDLLTPRFDTHSDSQGLGLGHGHSLASSRSVPAFTSGVVSSGLSPPAQSTQSRNIYISSVPANVTYEKLLQHAEQYGEILSVKLEGSLSHPPAEGRAFVMFKNVYDAHQFYSHLKRNGTPCELAKEDYGVVYKSLEDKNSSNLYIQGFHPNDTMEDIQKVLHPGKIVSSSRPLDNSGNIRGIVMARVQSRPQADEVIERLSGKWVHPITGGVLEIRIADSEAQKAYKKTHSNQLDGCKPTSSMPNMRYGLGSSYGQQSSKINNLSSESDWFANPSRESSYTSLRTASTNPPRTPTSASFRPRQSSNLSFNNSTWSSRHDHWSNNGGEPSTPTSQFFGVGVGHGRQAHGHGLGLGHRMSNEKLDMDHVRMLWPEESAGY